MSVSSLRSMRVLAGALSALALVGASGCGEGHDALEKQLTELRAEVSRLRAAQAAMAERLDADLAKSASATAAAPGMPAPGPSAPARVATTTSPREGDRPELDVVKLAPSEGDGDADNDPARPVLRAVGSGAERDRPTTLNNRTIAQRGNKKGITNANPAKTDDARPTVKQ